VRWSSVLLGLALCTAGGAEGQEPSLRTLAVSGSGRVTAPPDMARIEAGVTTQAASAADAMAANGAAMQRVLTAFEAQGIPERDVQTRRLQLFPVYSKRTAGEAPRVTGYRASNQVEVRVRNLEQVGAVLDGVSKAGANEIGNLRFEVADPAPLLDRARAAAVADAGRKAQLLAREAGVALGPVRELREAGVHTPPPVPMGRMAQEAVAVPVATGELEFRASVEIVYELTNR
jgi:uncharacterized protein YggE